MPAPQDDVDREFGVAGDPNEEPDNDEAAFGDLTSDAAAAQDELEEAAARQNAGEAPVSVDDEEEEPAAPAPEPIRPHAQAQATQPAPQAAPPLQTTRATVVRPPGGPPTMPQYATPPAQTFVQVPVKDETGKVIGYQELDADGNVQDEYAIDATGKKIPGTPPWLAEADTYSVQTIQEPPSDNTGLYVAGALVGGAVVGWFLKSLWEDYQEGG
jgi:hypothetical protein